MARKPIRRRKRPTLAAEQRATIAKLRAENRLLRKDNYDLFAKLVLYKTLERARLEAIESAEEYAKMESYARQPMVEKALDQHAGWWWRKPYSWLQRFWRWFE